MENTDFVIEHIDEEVQVIADQPSVVTNYPANTDFFIENIDSNVISIAHSLNIEASEVDFRPANTDFFIENIDKNVIAIAESMSLLPSEVDFRPANTDFFVENIDKNLIEIAESLSLTPYEVTIRPANTDMFIENIDKNVTLIKASTNVVTVSGEYININLPDGGKVQSAQIDGNATQTTYSGKNLFDGNNPLVITGSQDIALGKTYEAGTYTFSCTDITTTGSQFYCLMGVVYGGGSSTTQGMTVAGKKLTITATEEFDKVRVYSSTNYQQSQDVTTTFTNFMLEVGSTATSYEPYVGGTPAPNPSYPQPISVVTGGQTVKVVGKNLFHFTESRTVTAGGITFETTEGTSVLKINGTSTSSANFSINLIRDALPLTLEAGTYTIKVDGLNRITASTDYVYLGRVGVGAFAYINPNNNWQTTFTLTAKTSLYMQGVFASSTAYNNKEITIQLEQGTQATSYQAYTAQDYAISLGTLELAKIGTYQDHIYKSDSKWYIEKQVGKVVLDGTEDGWGRSSVANANNYYCTGVTDAANVPVNNKGAISPTLQSFTISQMFATTSEYGVALYNNAPSQIRLCFPIDELSTLAQVTTWLSTHPTTVYYALATPTTTEITNQSLIDQLEALASASLNQGVNNIFTEIATGNAMPTLKLVIEKY